MQNGALILAHFLVHENAFEINKQNFYFSTKIFKIISHVFCFSK